MSEKFYALLIFLIAVVFTVMLVLGIRECGIEDVHHHQSFDACIQHGGNPTECRDAVGRL